MGNMENLNASLFIYSSAMHILLNLFSSKENFGRLSLVVVI